MNTSGIRSSTKVSSAPPMDAKATLDTASRAAGMNRSAVAERSTAGHCILLPKDWQKRNRLHRSTGIRRGTHPNTRKNLVVGRPQTGQLRRLSKNELAAAREANLETVADAAAQLVDDVGASMMEVARALGLQASNRGGGVPKRVRRMLSGDNYRIGSLAELAAVCGRRLVVRFEEVSSGET